jgi:hypothetical protein
MKLQFLMEYNVGLRQPFERIGSGPFGTRGVAAKTGGSFSGPRLNGKVLPTGGDWYLVDANGVARLDVRITLETDDGALIYVMYYGIRRKEPDSPPRPADGADEYGDMYYMIAPRFETGDERYAWLNDLVCVAEGKGVVGGVAYRVYAVVND